MKQLLLINALWLTTQYAVGMSLSTGMTGGEIDKVVGRIGPSSAVKFLRSGDPYETFPGVKLGLEMALIQTGTLNDLGNQDGSLPSVHPLPRFYIAKGLFSDAELVTSFFPTGIIKGISMIGVGVKWAYLKEWESSVNLDFFVGYSYISAFEGTFTGNEVEVGATVSRDFVNMKPYCGLGTILSKGRVNPTFATSDQTSGTAYTVHGFVGMEIEMLMNLSVQLDLMNLLPAGTVFIGKRF